MQLENHLTDEEKLALIKLIFYIKFESEEPESLFYAGSHLINSALEKLLKTHPLYQKRLNFYGQIPEEHLNLLKQKTETDDLNIISPDLLKNYIYPYQMK